jgi:hypothetical protein
MKASKVLKRYAAGERNFQRLNLRGQSFKGQDLTGADFSEADIRSTNFTNANLRGVNFTGAECGLQKRWATLLTILSCLLAGISGLYSTLSGYLSLQMFDSFNLENQISDNRIRGFISSLVLIVFLILAIRQGIRTAAVAVVGLGAYVVAVVGGVVVGGGVVGGGVVIGGVAVDLAIGVTMGLGAIGLAVPGVGLAVAVGLAIGLAVCVPDVAYVAGVGLAVAGVGLGVVAVVVAVAGVYIGWRAMRGDVRDAWLRSFAIALAATNGTSFRGAELTGANFTGAKLKSTDFRKATLTRVRCYGAKMLDRVRFD